MPPSSLSGNRQVGPAVHLPSDGKSRSVTLNCDKVAVEINLRRMLTSAFCGSGVSRHQCRQRWLFEETSPPIFGNRDCKRLTVCLMFDGKVRPRCFTVPLEQSPTSLATVTWPKIVRETQLSTATTATTASGGSQDNEAKQRDLHLWWDRAIGAPRHLMHCIRCQP